MLYSIDPGHHLSPLLSCYGGGDSYVSVSAPAPGVALLRIVGPLVVDTSWSGVQYSHLSARVSALLDDLGTERIVVALDSPGGHVPQLITTCTRLRESVRRRNIPVDVHTSMMMTSAAYAIGSALCHRGRLTAETAARVGNVGVVKEIANLRGAADKAGVDVRYIADGPDKTALFPYGAWTDEQIAREQALTSEVAMALYSDVGISRAKAFGMSADAAAERVRAWQSRTYIGNQEAIDAGVIDAVATIDEVISAAVAAL